MCEVQVKRDMHLPRASVLPNLRIDSQHFGCVLPIRVIYQRVSTKRQPCIVGGLTRCTVIFDDSENLQVLWNRADRSAP